MLLFRNAGEVQINYFSIVDLHNAEHKAFSQTVLPLRARTLRGQLAVVSAISQTGSGTDNQWALLSPTAICRAQSEDLGTRITCFFSKLIAVKLPASLLPFASSCPGPKHLRARGWGTTNTPVALGNEEQRQASPISPIHLSAPDQLKVEIRQFLLLRWYGLLALAVHFLRLMWSGAVLLSLDRQWKS